MKKRKRAFKEPTIVQFHLESPTLYRYCDPMGVDVLRSLRLKVTPPAEFNDPFEFLPRVELTDTRDEIAKQMAAPKMVRQLWHDAGKPIPFSEFKRTYLEVLSTKGKRNVGRAFRAVEELAFQWRDNIPQFTGSHFGLVCYSEVPDDILMWGHYTKNHHGIVLGFNPTHQFFRTTAQMMPVIYRSERVDAAFGSNGGQIREPSLNLFRSKSIHWSYEKEWRQFFNIRDCVPMLTEAGGVRFFHQIPPRAIASVIVGVRAPIGVKEEVLKALNRPQLRHVKLMQAVLHEREFRISIVEV